MIGRENGSGFVGLVLLRIVGAAASLLVLGGFLVGADTAAAYRLQTKIEASPPQQGEGFGISVSIDGPRLLAGAWRNNEGATDGGAMYVFEPDAVGTWSEVAMLVPDDLSTSAKFGWRVSLSGDRAATGAADTYTNGIWTGAAYIYEREGGGDWVQAARLVGSDTAVGDRFGASVAIDGDRLVVGVLTDDDNGEDSGSAYIFERDAGGVWTEVAKLTASDPGGTHFGRACAISGDRVVIGATSLYGIEDPGAAYVFERDSGGAWNQVAKLVADDGALEDLFGWTVGIHGNLIAVGAQDNEAGGAPENSGAAYVFERDGGGVWAQVAKLTASNPVAQDRFGYSVDVSGERVAVGADTADGPGLVSGATYIFERDNGGNWIETSIVKAFDAKSTEWFGRTVTLDGDRLAVGANRLWEGSAYVYGVGAACPTSPAVGCRTGWGKASLLLKENVPGKEILRAVLKKGPATTAADLGDPVQGTTAYDLCVYDDADGLITSLSVHRGGQECSPGRACWKTKVGKNYIYGDRFGTSDGVSSVKLGFGAAGKSQILVKAGNRGWHSPMPTGGAAGLVGADTARVQFHVVGGDCFEADAASRAIPAQP